MSKEEIYMKKLEITYTAALACRNCEKRIIVEIPKGQTIAEFCKRTTCRACGCKTLY